MYRRYYNPYNDYPKPTKSQKNSPELNQHINEHINEQTNKFENGDQNNTYFNSTNTVNKIHEHKNKPEVIIPKKPATSPQQASISSFLADKLSFLGKLQADDIILIALILLFLLDGVEDEAILIVLIALFIIGR